MKTRSFLTLLLCICFCNMGFCQIWSNPITGTNPNTANPYTTGQTVSSTNMTVSGIGRGSGIAGSNANNRYNAAGWNSASIDANDYFYFTLTPNAGYKISFSSFQYTAQASGTGPVSFSFRSSVDGYSASIGAPTSTGTTIDLSGAAYQDIVSSITFRIYGWGASGAGGTFSINDFSFNGSVTAVSGGTSYASDWFRAAGTGNWNSASTWQSSHDGSTYFAATLVPNQYATAIYITSGNTVTVNTSVNVKMLTVNSGATLNNSNGNTITVYDGNSAGTGYDFIVDGTYILNGTQPDFNGTATAVVNNLTRVLDNTGGGSDDFAFNNKVTFSNGAVFEWAITTSFATSPASGFNLIYFPNSAVGTTPIFRVTSTMGNVGAGDNTIFNGKFEVTGALATVSFVNNGTKVFRDGIGGSGTITHKMFGAGFGDCGTFYIGDYLGGSANTPVIDGTITINIENAALANDMEIGSNATANISGSPVINIGTASSISTGSANFTISGTLTNSGANPVYLTYGSLTLAGYVDATVTFSANSSNTSVTLTKTTAGSAGILKFAAGANTIKDLNLNASVSGARVALGAALNVANSITLTYGIFVTDAYLLTWNNSGGTLSGPTGTSYANSFIATCDASGNPLTATGLSNTTTSPFTGDVGFRILNARGFAYIYLPVGPDLSRPNRMALNPGNNTGSDITVVVGKGDILYTPQPRVSRIWYVHTSSQANVAQSGIRLYFTKHNWATSSFGVSQDEIEDGFISSAVYVGRRDYTNDPHLTHRSALRDLGSLNGTEDYAEYLLNTAASSYVPAFYKFSAGNFSTIILPVSVTNLKAYQQGNNIAINWSALNEINVDRYEVEHSTNGTNFISISKTIALNNGSQQNNYSAVDAHPSSSKNFYRIKSIDKDGSVNYTSVVSVVIGGGKIFIAVVPNPVQNKHVNLQLNNIPAGRYDLALYSITGQRVYTSAVLHAGGSAAQVIGLPAHVKTGTYVLVLHTETNHYTQKIVVE